MDGDQRVRKRAREVKQRELDLKRRKLDLESEELLIEQSTEDVEHWERRLHSSQSKLATEEQQLRGKEGLLTVEEKAFSERKKQVTLQRMELDRAKEELRAEEQGLSTEKAELGTKIKRLDLEIQSLNMESAVYTTELERPVLDFSKHREKRVLPTSTSPISTVAPGPIEVAPISIVIENNVGRQHKPRTPVVKAGNYLKNTNNPMRRPGDGEPTLNEVSGIAMHLRNELEMVKSESDDWRAGQEAWAKRASILGGQFKDMKKLKAEVVKKCTAERKAKVEAKKEVRNMKKQIRQLTEEKTHLTGHLRSVKEAVCEDCVAVLGQRLTCCGEF